MPKLVRWERLFIPLGSYRVDGSLFFLFVDRTDHKGEEKHMQVVIDLYAPEPGVNLPNKEEEQKWRVCRLYELLRKLEEVGYEIHSLYGNFLFDNHDRRIVDIGEPGKNLIPSIGMANEVYLSGGKLAVVFVEEHYVVFANRFFLAIHLCHMRKIRPISIEKALKRFRQLFLSNANRAILNILYKRQFEEFYGMDARPVPTILGDRHIHRDGFAIPDPFFDPRKQEYEEEETEEDEGGEDGEGEA